MTTHNTSVIIAEGKTKIVCQNPDDKRQVTVQSKPDITAGDGDKHDVINGKAGWATTTTCNVFRLLKSNGIPVAFERQLSTDTFLAQRSEMIPLEVVVRREAHGSFLKRYPELTKGQVFNELVFELFLKTSNKTWLGYSLPKDDPFMIIKNNTAELYLPDQPFQSQKPFLFLDNFPLKNDPSALQEIESIAKKTFLLLEKAWQFQGGRLVDFKLEFGFNVDGKLVLSDVIDNDSWRVILNGGYIDKQVYRDGGSLDEVATKYASVAEITSRF